MATNAARKSDAKNIRQADAHRKISKYDQKFDSNFFVSIASVCRETWRKTISTESIIFGNPDVDPDVMTSQPDVIST